MQNVLDLFKDETAQHNMTQRLIEIDARFQQLTNYRRVGNKYDKKLLTVVNGYNKIMNLLDRFNVKS